MTTAAVLTKAITVEDSFPHPPEVVWKALTDSTLIQRWLMPPTGFAAVAGTPFTYQTKPAGNWDGTIRCQVTEVRAPEFLSYTWKGGDGGNAGYGSRLDTEVTFTLTRIEGGTHLRIVHSGFELPRNEVAYQNMSNGWATITQRLRAAIED